MFSLASMRIRKWFAWGLLPPLLMGAEQLRYPCWPHYNSVQIPSPPSIVYSAETDSPAKGFLPAFGTASAVPFFLLPER